MRKNRSDSSRSRSLYFDLAVAVLVLVVTAGGTAKAATWQVQVSAGDHSRRDTPVSCELPAELRGKKAFSLKRADDGKAIAVQRVPGDPPRIVWLIRENLAAGQSRNYLLAAAEHIAGGDVTCHDDKKQLCVKIGDRNVLCYNHARVSAPEGIASHYEGNGYIHPIYNPAGKIVTDDFAPDHPHQHGLFGAWVKTAFAGREVDFWNQAGGKAVVEHHKFVDAPVSGPVFAQFTAQRRHVVLPGKQQRERQTALLEDWRVRVYNLTDHFLLDLEARQRCATDTPLTVKKYHYGGLAIRGHRDWLGADWDWFLTSEGKGVKDGNHTRPHWVTMHGRVGGGAAGFTIFGHPANFRFPQHVRLHPSKPYFCFIPTVSGPMTIAPDRDYVSAYRFCIFDGEPNRKLLDRIWTDYASPPNVKVSKR